MVMRKPVKVLMKTKEGFKEVPSPFRFKAADKIFQNAWNFKQTIFMEGTLEITMRLENLLSVLVRSDLIPKVLTKLGNIRVLDSNEKAAEEETRSLCLKL
jgi:hypothetical protein